MRTRDQQVDADFQRGHGLFSRYGGEMVQESLERVTCGQIIHHILDWDAGPCKDGHALVHAYEDEAKRDV